MNEFALFFALISAVAAGVAVASRKELKLRPIRVRSRQTTNRRSR